MSMEQVPGGSPQPQKAPSSERRKFKPSANLYPPVKAVIEIPNKKRQETEIKQPEESDPVDAIADEHETAWATSFDTSEKQSLEDKNTPVDAIDDAHIKAWQKPLEQKERSKLTEQLKEDIAHIRNMRESHAITNQLNKDLERQTYQENLKKILAAVEKGQAESAPAQEPARESAPPIPERVTDGPPPLHPAFPDLAHESMLDTAGRMGKKAAATAAEEFPHTALGNVVNKADRMGMRMLSAPGIAFNRLWHSWRSRRAETAREKYNAEQKAVGDLEKQLAAATTSRGRNKLTRALNKAKHRTDKRRDIFEHRSHKALESKNKLHAIGLGGNEWVKEKMQGSIEKFAELKAEEEKVQKKIDWLNTHADGKREGLIKFRAQLKEMRKTGTTDLFDRLQHTIDVTAQVIENAKYSAQKARRDIEALQKRMRRVNTTLTQWQTEGNRYLRMGGEEHINHDLQKQESTRPLQEHAFSRAPQPPIL